MRYCGAPGSVGSLMKYYALPADMAPHLPPNISWDESGSVQPVAVGVQIGKRVDLRPHQAVAIL
jgi:D-xylulose reductase